jgi:hypothetical protein
MIPYQKIRALIRQLQPNTIVIDHNGGVPWEVDAEYFEEPLGVTVPSGNVIAGAQGQTIAKDKGWFWRSTQAAAGYLSASSIANEIKGTESNYTNFILDCPPNLQGLLEAPVVTALGQVPQYWTPNAARAPLPQQLPKVETPLTPVSATATSGDAALAIDGYNDSIKGVNNTMHSNKGESLWTSTGALPQSITLNLGKSYDNIDMLEYLPQRHTGTTAGNITSYKVLVSKDSVTFTQVATGTWPADPTYHGLLCPQRVQFPAQTAQYVRLEADAVSGGGTSAIVGEIAVGSSGTTGAGGNGGTGGSSGAGGSGGSSGVGGSGGATAGGAGGSAPRTSSAAGAAGGSGGTATGGAGGRGGTVASAPLTGGTAAAGGVGGIATSTSGLGGSAAGGATAGSGLPATFDAGTGTGGSTGNGGATGGATATPDAATSTGGIFATTGTGTSGVAGSGGTSVGIGGSTSAAGGTTGTAAPTDAGAGAFAPASSSGCSCALNGRSSSAPLSTSAWLLFGLAALIRRTRRGR